MIGAVENVLEALHEEPEQRLVPTRIERDDAGVAFDLEHALDAARAEEAHGVDDAHAEPLRARPNREQRARRLDRRFELHVEQRLLPRQLDAGRQRRSARRCASAESYSANERSLGIDARTATISSRGTRRSPS